MRISGKEDNLIFLYILLLFVCIVLCALILLQPGSAEGLAGALGGYGSQSPFGTKTAQKITRLTMYIGALLFIIVVAIEVMQKKGVFAARTLPAEEAPAVPAADKEEGTLQEAPGKVASETLPEGGEDPAER